MDKKETVEAGNSLPPPLGSPVIVTRVYNNGDRVTKTMTPHDANEEIAYNRECRYGCAVFAGSVCVQEGYLGSERCAAINRELANTGA